MVRPISSPLFNVGTLSHLRIALTSPYIASSPYAQRLHESMPQPLRRLFASSPAYSQNSAAGQQRARGGEKTFTYGLAASYSAKRHRLNLEKNVYTYDPRHEAAQTTDHGRDGGSSSVKHTQETRPQSGEDAYFISPVADTNTIALAVVDGVGGWQDSGIDPADFAHGLCDYMAAASRAFPQDFNSSATPSPKEILEIGHARVQNDPDIEAGGSTACVATLTPSGQLSVANLGDSGFVHLAPGAVRFVSDAQTHAFNTPFQLSKLPRAMLRQMALFQGGSKPLHDSPDDAAVVQRELRHGDVLVFATDGVWDNLSPSDALAIVTRVMAAANAWPVSDVVGDEKLRDAAIVGATRDKKLLEGTVTTEVAKAIVKEAKEAGLDQQREGPFAREVRRHFPNERWHGGKPDDICVVVVVVVEKPTMSKQIRAKL